jgi:choline-glycine betaine transporter
MTHSNRLVPWLVAAAAVAALLVAFGAPLASVLPFAIVLACPLMMVFMMRGMAGMHGSSEDHTGHGCEHDPTRPVEPPTTTLR